MQKIIKLSDEHYIVVDDSEKPAIDDWVIDIKNPKLPRQIKTNHLLEDLYESEKKITHSSKSLSDVPHYAEYGMLNVQQVEKVIYGYSVEEMGAELAYKRRIKYQSQYEDGVCSGLEEGYISGFRAHQELVKDKFFTIEDIKLCYMQAWNRGRDNMSTEMNDYIKSLLPKTEWNVEIDEQGKVKLL